MRTEFKHFRCFEEIESYWLETQNVEPSLLQLSGGQMDFRVRNDDFDGVFLTWVKSTGRQFWRDSVTDQGLHFGFVIESAGPVRCGGKEIGGTDALMWLPDCEIDYLLEGPLTSLEISVSPEITQDLGWQPSGGPINLVDATALATLLQVCTMASEWLGASEDLPKDTRSIRGRLWREWILDALQPAVTPWINWPDTTRDVDSQWTKHFEIVRKSEKRFDLDDPELMSDAELMARDLGISRRSLFYAFQRTLGIGPRKYYELQRLHELRRALKSSQTDQVSVTDLAIRFGFTQLGRMAGIYRRHFGETPSETLRRSN